jgi:hypothetical protein
MWSVFAPQVALTVTTFVSLILHSMLCIWCIREICGLNIPFIFYVTFLQLSLPSNIHIAEVNVTRVVAVDDEVWSWVLPYSDPRMTTMARFSSRCKLQTRPLVREDVSHQHTRIFLRVIKIWSWAPGGCPTPRQTCLLTVNHNIILTLTWVIQLLSSALSKGPNGVGVSLPLPHLWEAVPDSEMLCFLVFRISNKWQSPEIQWFWAYEDSWGPDGVSSNVTERLTRILV